MAYRPLSAVVLAAGEGTRMRSRVPKVLHPLCGRPMLLHVIDTLVELPLERIVVVVGHQAETVTKTLQNELVTDIPVEFVEQRVPRGTGDATSVALTAFSDTVDDDDVIVLSADIPLLRAETLAVLATEHRLADAAATLLTAELDDPTGYGRIVRDARGTVERIVEQSDGNPEELAIREVNPSIYCFRRAFLAPALRRVSPENAQGEYYLTDVIEVLRSTGHSVLAVPATDATETLGVNDRAQLAAAETLLRERINVDWMRAGVTMSDPARTYIDATVELAEDVRLLPGTVLEGRTSVGAGSVIGPDTRLVDTIVGEDVDDHLQRHARGRDRRRRDRRPVRAPAAGDAARARGEDRQLRGDEERRDRRGREGEPPRLRRRRRGRAQRQRRRGHDHRQLRRPQQAPHEDRSRRQDRLQHRARRAGRGRRRRDHRRGRGGEPRRAAQCAREGRTREDRGGLGRTTASPASQRAGASSSDGARHHEEARPGCRQRQPRAVAGDRRLPERAARRDDAVEVRQRRDLLPLRRQHPRLRRLRASRATASRSTTASWSSCS